MPRIRHATHAGSWYQNKGEHLDAEIGQWLEEANAKIDRPAKVIISPHAGFRYSGHVMAHAYAHIQPEQVKRIFLLGPSHHHYTQECLLSRATAYNTPHGPIQLDEEICSELHESGNFGTMTQDIDEAEHSLELQLPYIWHIMRGHEFKLIPILIGALSRTCESMYGQILSKYLDDPGNLFVISSDFCHWGHRFNYTFFDPSKGNIHESIEWLDRKGMDLIIEGDAHAFSQYLKQYGNTICGRFPIAVMLQMLRFSSIGLEFELMRYDQSSKVTEISESSVSYVAAVGFVRQTQEHEGGPSL